MDFSRGPHSARVSMISGRSHYETVIDAVRGATQSVWIATANLKQLMVESRHRIGRSSYQSVLADLDELAGNGVELRILHATLPSRPFRDSFDSYPRLVEGGLQLRMCPRVHLKTVIVDARFAYIGSANWTGAGLGAKGSGRRNFELGFTTDDERIIDDVQAMYHSIWTGEPCADCRLRDSCELPLDQA